MTRDQDSGFSILDFAGGVLNGDTTMVIGLVVAAGVVAVFGLIRLLHGPYYSEGTARRLDRQRRGKHALWDDEP